MRRHARMAVLAGVLSACALLAAAGSASAITPVITEFSTGLSSGSVPLEITRGPDGNLWFTDPAFSPNAAVGRIDPITDAIAEFKSGLQTTGSGSVPRDIAAGQDGNLWFTDQGCGGTAGCEIGQINPATHAIAEFNVGLNSGSSPEGIAAGPDGNLWFTDRATAKAIGRINPVTHAISEYSTPVHSGGDLSQIAAGPDGNLWFTEPGSTFRAIGRINPGTHAIDEYTTGLNTGSLPRGITAGPDGNLWFADPGTTRAIGRIDPVTHVITEFSAGLNPGSQPERIATGPDGHLWFTDNGTTRAIGRIDPATGAINEFSAGLDQMQSGPGGIALGADGNLWFANRATSSIARITTPPTAQTLSAAATGPTSASVSGAANGRAQPTSFHIEFGVSGGATTTTSPEQSLGTTRGDTPLSASLTGLKPGTTYRARVVVTNLTDTVAGAFVTFVTPPQVVTVDRIGSLRITPAALFAAPKGPSALAATVKRRRRTTGAIVTYTNTAAATTTFTVQRATVGRRQGRSCVRTTRRNRGHRHCTRFVGVGSFTRASAAGRARFRFTGRVRRRKLRPASYRMQAIPRNGAGKGPAVYRRFRVKP